MVNPIDDARHELFEAISTLCCLPATHEYEIALGLKEATKAVERRAEQILRSVQRPGTLIIIDDEINGLNETLGCPEVMQVSSPEKPDGWATAMVNAIREELAEHEFVVVLASEAAKPPLLQYLHREGLRWCYISDGTRPELKEYSETLLPADHRPRGAAMHGSTAVDLELLRTLAV